MKQLYVVPMMKKQINRHLNGKLRNGEELSTLGVKRMMINVYYIVKRVGVGMLLREWKW